MGATLTAPVSEQRRSPKAAALSDALVFFGATGDLAYKQIFPSLQQMIRRGNLNGLPNFLDIFRTLNGLLFTYHTRGMAEAGPVIPFAYVTTYVMNNLELLIGPFEPLPRLSDTAGRP